MLLDMIHCEKEKEQPGDHSCTSFMMGERAKLKDRGKSQLAFSSNAKEEIILNKHLRILESIKKQAVNSITLDQRTLYNRFSVKLRRSEVAHAKLFGNLELIKQLSRSLFPGLHTVVTDGSEKAVRIILQNTEASRAISAPCQSWTHLSPISIDKNHSCKALQGKEAKIKDLLLSATKELDSRTGEHGRHTSGAKRVRRSEAGTAISEPGSIFASRRPHNASHQRSDWLSVASSQYPERFGDIPSQTEHPAPQTARASMSLSPEGLRDKVLKENCMVQNCKSKQVCKQRPTSRNLFLGLTSTSSGIYPCLDDHMAISNHDLLDKKVKLFLEKITALKQEQICPLQNYYSECLLEKVGRKCQIRHDFLCDTEQEQSKWNPVGPETSHRSITVKKLDRNFMEGDNSFEILIQEYYNEIITKENLLERNWLNNNPYQLITN